MKTEQLLIWLEEQADNTATYSERVAYLNVIRYIKDNS